MDFRFYFSLFMRRLHWFILLTVLGSALGFTLARVLPTVYVAQSRLVVESEQIPDAMAASTVQTQATEALQIIQQRVTSRDTLVDMANRLKIYGTATGQPMDADALVEDLRQRISIVTTGGTTTRGPIQATLVTVGFEAPTAAMSAAVTNELVTLILKENVDMRTSAARDTLDFFTQEVARLDKELTDRGAQILKFKDANKDALPDSLDFRRSQQAAAQERLQQLDRDGADLQERRDRLVQLHNAAVAAGDPTAGAAMTTEARQLAALRDQLAAQQALLSPENPKIKLLQTQIDALVKIVAAQSDAGTGQPLSAYDVQLADIDGQLASISENRKQTEGEIEALQATIEATPANAIALDALQRDYDNTRAQYDQTVANKARAETGDTIEAMSKGQRIAVIEQAVAPQDPSRPNRPLIAAAGVIGGVLLGLGLIILIEMLNRSIRRPSDLTAKLGIAVFATLPYLETRSEVRRRRLWRLIFVLVACAVVAAALWAVNTYYMPLDLLMDQMLRRVSLLTLPTPTLV